MSYLNIPIAFLYVTFAFITKKIIYVIHDSFEINPYSALYYFGDPYSSVVYPLGGVVSQKNKILFYGHVNDVFIHHFAANQQTNVIFKSPNCGFCMLLLLSVRKQPFTSFYTLNDHIFSFLPFFITSQLLYSIINHLPKQNLSILCTIRLYKLRKL